MIWRATSGSGAMIGIVVRLMWFYSDGLRLKLIAPERIAIRKIKIIIRRCGFVLDKAIRGRRVVVALVVDVVNDLC